jgi:hypothetical protein
MTIDPWADVRNPAYGAVGNGSTDDTAAIQAAINAIQSAGAGAVFVPNGNYYVPGGLRITGNGVRFINAGGFFQTGNTDVPIFSISAAYCTLENVAALGAGIQPGGVSPTQPVVSLTNCLSCLLDNCNISGGAIGVDISGGADNHLRDLTSVSIYGPHVRTRNTNAFLSRCKLDQSFLAPVPLGTVLSDLTRDTFYPKYSVVSYAGYVLQCQTAGRTLAGTGPTLQNYNVPIPDNTAVWQLINPYGACALAIDVGTSALTCSGCDFSGLYEFCVIIRNSVPGPAPTALAFTDCDFGNAWQGGIYAYDGAGLNVKGSLFSNFYAPWGMGVYLTNNWQGDTTIADNLMFGCAYGVQISAGTNTVVKGNQIAGCSQTAVGVANASQFVISDNCLGSSATWGRNAHAVLINGTCDHYNVVHNIIAGASSGVTDSGGGTHTQVNWNN